MQNGFKKVALGITGVALLSGTTFAVGPTVQSPPTMIITDRVKDTTVQDLGIGGAIYEGSPTDASDTFNIYRFTEAFNLQDYVTFTEGAGLADVKWDFAEVDGSDTIITGAARTIEITANSNSQLGLVADPTFGDVNSSAFADVGSTDPLTFLNVNRTTGSGPAAANFVDNTKVKLFATNVNDSGQQVVSATFDIITTNDYSVAIGDSFSAPSTIFTPVAGYENLDGWYLVFNLNYGPNFVYDANGYTLTNRGFTTTNEMPFPTITPAAGSLVTAGTLDLQITPPGTAALRIQTLVDAAAGQRPTNVDASLQPLSPQLASWGSFTEDVGGQSFDVTEGNIYMTRWSITNGYSPNQAYQQPTIELSVGSSTEYGLGRSAMSFGVGLANPVGAQDYKIFFYAHGDGPVGMYLALFDLNGNNATNYPFGHVGGDLQVDRIDVLSFVENDLNGKTVVHNQGGALGTFTLAAGQPAVDNTGYTGPFDLDLWMWVDEQTGLRNFVNTPRNSSSDPVNPVEFRAAGSATNDTLSLTIGTGVGFVQPYWSTAGSFFVNADGGAATEAFEATEDQIVVADFFISSPSGNDLPYSRVGFQTSQIGANGTENQLSGTAIQNGSAGFYLFTPSGRAGTNSDNSTTTQPLALNSNLAKRARYVFQPQIQYDDAPPVGFTGDTSAFAFRLRSEVFSAPGPFAADLGSWPIAQKDRAGTIRLHRTTVTYYDAPADIDTATIPVGLVE